MNMGRRCACGPALASSRVVRGFAPEWRFLSLGGEGTVMRRVLIFAVLTVFAACAQAAIYKCVDASGKTSYMESPCASGAESTSMSRQGRRVSPPAAANEHAADKTDKAAEARAEKQSPLQLPPPPSDGKFVQDYAYLIDSDAALEVIKAAQHDAFVHNDTPIMVVTISSMARLGGEGYSIEKFARAWFDRWQIGKRASNGAPINRGILLLVSRDERKARIELGADWGSRFDTMTARIMDGDIVPKFKKGDYAGGLADGVKALATMAKTGPEGHDSIVDRAASMVRGLGGPNARTPLPLYAVLALLGIGTLMVFGCFFIAPPERYRVLLHGVGMIAAALVFWVVLGVIAVLVLGWLVRRYGNTSSRRDRGEGEAWGARTVSGDAGGGDSGGGGSGGGGASGSW